MIDSVFYNLEKSKESRIREDLNLTENEYAVTTLHRPSNVDEKEIFTGLLDALVAISEKIPIIFPVHPRTRTISKNSVLPNKSKTRILNLSNRSAIWILCGFIRARNWF